MLGLTLQLRPWRLPTSSLERERWTWQCRGPLACEELAVGDEPAAISDHLEDWAAPSSTSLREGGALESPPIWNGNRRPSLRGMTRRLRGSKSQDSGGPRESNGLLEQEWLEPKWAQISGSTPLCSTVDIHSIPVVQGQGSTRVRGGKSTSKDLSRFFHFSQTKLKISCSQQLLKRIRDMDLSATQSRRSRRSSQSTKP